jgi:ABC-type lipoprotein release transport system permease subunit
MSNPKEQKFMLVKMPSMTRLLIGGGLAFWLSTIMNPAFVAIAVLVVLLIPVLSVDNMFSSQFEKAYRQPKPPEPKKISKTEYLESKIAAEEKKEAEPAASPVAKNAKPTAKKGKKGK